MNEVDGVTQAISDNVKSVRTVGAPLATLSSVCDRSKCSASHSTCAAQSAPSSPNPTPPAGRQGWGCWGWRRLTPHVTHTLTLTLGPFSTPTHSLTLTLTLATLPSGCDGLKCSASHATCAAQSTPTVAPTPHRPRAGLVGGVGGGEGLNEVVASAWMRRACWRPWRRMSPCRGGLALATLSRALSIPICSQ